MAKDYTGRFRVQAGSTRRLLLDDGNLRSGFRIDSIELIQMQGETVDMVVLHTNDADYRVSPFNIGMEYNQQIAWGTVVNGRITHGGSNPIPFTGTDVTVDPNHIIVNDLYVTNTDQYHSIDVLIHLRKVKITPEENILYQLKERAQAALT